MKQVFVICRNGHTEGYSAPIQAFASYTEACNVARLMGHIDSFDVFAVPIWPEAQSEPWHSIKPCPEPKRPGEG